MWNKLPVTIRIVAEELGFRRLLKEHLLASLWYGTGRLSTNWGSAPWLAAVLLRRGPCHHHLWSDWLEKQCRALMLAVYLLCSFAIFSSFALVSFFCSCDISFIHTYCLFTTFLSPHPNSYPNPSLLSRTASYQAFKKNKFSTES